VVWSTRWLRKPFLSRRVYQTCYPPAVNYTPLYYLFNGVAFNKTATTSNPSLSRLCHPRPNTGTGTVLVASSRWLWPARAFDVGSQTGTAGSSGIRFFADRGRRQPLPGVPRVQSEVFMAAGKTYECDDQCARRDSHDGLSGFDRQLSLSGNATSRDAGMLAYISINGTGLPAAPAITAAAANPDSYSVVPGVTLTVSNPPRE